MQSYLPEMVGMESANCIRKGRNVYEGTQRGWGIEYGDLRQRIINDPLFQDASEASGGVSIITEDKRFNLFLLFKFFLEKIPIGDIVEFGSYKCGNAIFMAHLCETLHPVRKVYALDSFQGMPPVDKTVDAHGQGDFGDSNYEEALARVKASGVRNLVVVKGLFEDTVPGLFSGSLKKIALAHIDCDIYSAVKYSYCAVKSHMVEGGYYVFDDPNGSSCPGAIEAIEELLYHRDGMHSEQFFPHLVFRNYGGAALISPRTQHNADYRK